MKIKYCAASKSSYLLLISFGLLVVYDLQLAEMNGYMGYVIFPKNLDYFISASMGLLLTAAISPVKFSKPSDFFLFFYSLFVLLPYAVLHPIRHSISSLDFLFYFSLISLPVVVIKIVTFIGPRLRVQSIFSEKIIIYFLVLVSVGGAAFTLLDSPPSSGFNLLEIYVRRIEAREIFTAGSLQAYINSMVINGFAPILAFYAGFNKKRILFLLSILIWMGYFYTLGLKAPLLYILAAFFFGGAVRIGYWQNANKLFYFLFLSLIILSLIEYFIFEYSFISDFVVRRAFSVPPYLLSAYFDFMNSSSAIEWSSFVGVVPGAPITFIVGEDFLGFKGLNANTNAFVYGLAAGGVFDFFFVIILVGAFFAVLDGVYAVKKIPALLYLGMIYSILIAEQAATTALVSSGIGVLVLVFVYSKTGNPDPRHPIKSIIEK